MRITTIATLTCLGLVLAGPCAAAEDAEPKIEHSIRYLPFENADFERLLAGEIITHDYLKELMPNFYGALVNYPGDTREDIRNRFALIKLMANGRPVYVLARRTNQLALRRRAFE